MLPFKVSVFCSHSILVNVLKISLCFKFQKVCSGKIHLFNVNNNVLKCLMHILSSDIYILNSYKVMQARVCHVVMKSIYFQRLDTNQVILLTTDA